MSAYDPGRKPPLSANTISQPQQPQQTYNDYNIGSTQQPQLSSNVKTIILTVIPNGLNQVDQIACIILSSDGTERESFSFKFDMNNPFDAQADYLGDTLNGAQWFATDQYDIQQILDTSFRALNKSSPSPSRLISATQYFNDYKINQIKFNSVIGATNARIGCSNIYSLLISISISNSLSALSTNAMPTQTIQPVIQSPNDYNNNTSTQPDAFNNTLQSSYDPNNNNNAITNTTNYDDDNTQISQKNNDYQASTIQNISADTNNNNDPQRNNYTNTQFNEQNDSNNVINNAQINETQPVENNTSNDMNIINNNITSNEQQYNEPINNDNNGHYQQPQMDVINNNNEEIQQQQTVQNEQILNEPKEEEPEQSQMIQQQQPETQPQQVSNPIIATNDISEDLESSQKENVEQNIQSSITPTVTATDNTSSALIESSLSPSEAQQQQQAPQQTSALSKKSSWASKFRTPGQSSPKRKQLGVIDRVSDNIYKSGGKGKLSATTTRDGIRNSIADAITKNKEGKKSHVIWVSYAGHQKPFIPRGIKPIGWDQRSSKGGRDSSFFAIQHKAKSQNQQKFYLKNVLEVRRTQWRIPANELAQLQRKHPTATTYNQYNQYNNYNNNQNDNNNYNQRQGGYRNNYGNNNQNRGNNQNRRSNQRGNYNSNQGGSNTGNQNNNNNNNNNQSGNK